MNPIASTFADIRRLALNERPGSIVLAEHAVDRHAEIFSERDDRATALDALARDLIRLGRTDARLVSFLSQIDDYIGIVQRRG